MKAKILSLVLLAVLLAGCATRKPSVYEFPPRTPPADGAKSLGALPATSERYASNDLDKILNIPQGLDEVVLKEMESTGRFSYAIPVTKLGASKDSTDFVLHVTLKQLDWEIPDRDAINGTTFGVTVATGAIGGLVYGSTSTEVKGRATMALKLTNSKGWVVLNKEYSGRADMKVAKMNCDTPATGRKVAGKAVKDIMDQFKKDLSQVNLQ